MKNIFKYLLLISAILMMAMGFWFIFNPTASLKTTTILIGLLLGGNGLVEIFSFLQERKVWNISKWILFDGFASLIAGIFIYSIQELPKVHLSLPLLFGYCSQALCAC